MPSLNIYLIEKKFTLSKLSKQEIANLERLLKERGVITKENKDEIINVIKNESQNFLLAVMLAATHGKPLVDILRNVVDRIFSFKNGGNVVKALGIIVTIESFKDKNAKCVRDVVD